MMQFISFALISGCMIFIWSFVFLNRSHDKINQSFLWFLSVIIIWMTLSAGNDLIDTSLAGIVAKTVYWYSMLTMSLFFLRFVYRLVKRELDFAFHFFVVVNLLTILARYLYPIDYSDPTFWRLSEPVVAPIMSMIFSAPAVFALALVFKGLLRTKDKRVKAQFKSIFLGTGIALSISVISEYILPTLFNVNMQLSLMYYAFFVFVLCLFISIMKHRLLYLRSDYIYQKLFLNSVDGIIIVNKNARIININNVAKQILRDENLDSGDMLTDYIKDYMFDINYSQQEMRTNKGDQTHYLAVTQHPIDMEEQGTAKLMIISDISAAKLSQQREKDRILEKTTTDQLTKVFNKQYFIDKCCADDGEPTDSRLSLLFIDVDNFKTINDQFGHLTGDKVLAELAECFKKTVETNQEIIRFGGDEFIILLENTGIEQARAIAEKIRSEVSNACVLAGDNAIKVTLSIGVTEGCAPFNDLLMKADMAMYQSKYRGKNAITVFFEGESDEPYRMKL